MKIDFINGTIMTLVVTSILNVDTKNTSDNFHIIEKVESKNTFYKVKVDQIEALKSISTNSLLSLENNNGEIE